MRNPESNIYGRLAFIGDLFSFGGRLWVVTDATPDRIILRDVDSSTLYFTEPRQAAKFVGPINLKFLEQIRQRIKRIEKEGHK